MPRLCTKQDYKHKAIITYRPLLHKVIVLRAWPAIHHRRLTAALHLGFIPFIEVNCTIDRDHTIAR